MSGALPITSQLLGLRRTVTVQRLARAVLRAAWLTGAGLLTGWALSVLTGTVFNSILLVVVAGLLGLAGIVPIFWKWPAFERFLWRLDRLLDLKEQVSTAWNALQDGSDGALVPALQEDVLALLPGVRRRILRRGWSLSGDVLSLAVVLVLGGAVYLGAVPAVPVDSMNGTEVSQPPAFQAQEASRQEVLPKGILSLDTSVKSAVTQSQPAGKPTQTPSNPPADQPQANDLASANQVLQKVGQQLSQQASSYELGQALQQGDLDQAANQLEQVADKLDSLSPDTRSQLASAMSQAAGALQGQQVTRQLAQDLNQAAGAIKSGQPSQAQPSGQGDQATASSNPRDAMDQVANDLRDLSSQLQGGDATGGGAENGSGSNGGQGASLSGGGPKQGSPSPMTRLQGESGDFKLDVNDPALAGILVPGPTRGTGSTVASGSTDQGASTSDVTNQAILFPYSYDWKWQALIAQYFQRSR